jgi:hypothetical protein
MTPMVQRIMIACAVLAAAADRRAQRHALTELRAVSVPGVFSHGFLWSRSPTCGCLDRLALAPG